MKRALVIVLDSVGCGRAPDAEAYGDAGADSVLQIAAHEETFGLHLPSQGIIPRPLSPCIRSPARVIQRA